MISPEMLILILAPVGVAVCKRLAIMGNKHIPKVALPMLAPILGVIVNLLMGQLGMETATLTAAVGAGLAGIGIREVGDQGMRFARD